MRKRIGLAAMRRPARRRSPRASRAPAGQSAPAPAPTPVRRRRGARRSTDAARRLPPRPPSRCRLRLRCCAWSTRPSSSSRRLPTENPFATAADNARDAARQAGLPPTPVVDASLFATIRVDPKGKAVSRAARARSDPVARGRSRRQSLDALDVRSRAQGRSGRGHLGERAPRPGRRDRRRRRSSRSC